MICQITCAFFHSSKQNAADVFTEPHCPAAKESRKAKNSTDGSVLYLPNLLRCSFAVIL